MDIFSTPLTLFVGYLAQKWNLNPMITLQISKWIDTIVIDFSGIRELIFDIIPEGFIGYVATVVTMVGLIWGLMYVRTRYRRSREYTITIYTPDDIGNINTYFSLYPDAMELTSVDVGSPYKIQNGNANLIIPKIPTPFRIDDIHGLIHLAYHYRETTVETESGDGVKSVKEHIPYLVLTLTSSPVHVSTFLKLVRRKLFDHDAEQSKKQVVLKGYQIKTIDKGDIKWLYTTMLNCSRVEYDPNKYKREWFYRDREHMFQSLQSALSRGDNWNIIAYGPPGTGKSSLGATIAKYLGRSLYSINLSYLNRPQLLEILFGCPYRMAQAVFILEELDHVIARIDDQEAHDRNNHMVIDGHAVRTPPDPNALRTSDLLEIFQGPIPRPGLIIIATTNNLEFIRKRLPALIRPGRLTPWKIDTIDTEVFAQIIFRYFGADAVPFDLPVDHGLPTSQIVEYAKSSLGDYARFKTLMQEALS